MSECTCICNQLAPGLLAYAGIGLHNPAVTGGMDKVFKAVGDPTRRYLLDSLHEHNGQTLSELCAQLDMARQSATQHLTVLEAANLVNTVWRGRERLHYLNPVPLHEIQERWIHKFEGPRLRALSRLKRRAEEHAMTDKPTLSTSRTSRARRRGSGAP
jgi:DNA-binding transcriptional ArsR family regulator